MGVGNIGGPLAHVRAADFAVRLFTCATFQGAWNVKLRMAPRGRGGEAIQGLVRELNPGPLAPEARIMPLDQAACDDMLALIS